MLPVAETFERLTPSVRALAAVLFHEPEVSRVAATVRFAGIDHEVRLDLEAVTHRENVLRGVGATAVHAAKTHCANGHPFDEVNTYITPRGHRVCRTCQRKWRRETKARKRARERAGRSDRQTGKAAA